MIMKYFGFVISLFLFSCVTIEELPRKTFSNTQEWYAYAHRIAKRDLKTFQITDEELAAFPPPPANDSLETQSELALLKKFQENRSRQDIKQTTKEMQFCGWKVGDYRLGIDPDLDRFLFAALYDASSVGMRLKKQFDRVRPSFLDRTITPGIEVPKHASYPSNHSLQSHFLALILGDFYPQHKNDYLASAEKIAKNREIVGVHYPSDSKLGKMVATYLYQKIQQNPKYLRYLKKRKGENVDFNPNPGHSVMRICEQLNDKSSH
jgi:acid phosphatase (class A)